MFQSVSWSQCLEALSAAIFCYYIAMAIIFYRNQIRRFIMRTVGVQPHSVLSRIGYLEPTDDLFLLANQSSTIIYELILRAAANKMAREELVLALGLTFNRALPLRSTPFQTALNALVQGGLTYKCSIVLSDEELVGIWHTGTAEPLR